MTSSQPTTRLEARREDNSVDIVDPFTLLTSSSSETAFTHSRPVFVPAAQPEPLVARTPPSAAGEFGPFVSVSTNSDPLSGDSVDCVAQSESGLSSTHIVPEGGSAGSAIATPAATTSTAVTQFNTRRLSGLGAFGEEATRRNKENEERVLKELRLFEDTHMATKPIQIVEADLPWWLQLGTSNTADSVTVAAAETKTTAAEADNMGGLLIDIGESAATPTSSAATKPSITTAESALKPEKDDHPSRARSRSRGNRRRKPHTPRATPEATPPSSSSPSPTTSDEEDKDGITARRPPRRGERRSSSQPRISSSRASHSHHQSPSPPPSSSGSGFSSSTSIFGAYATPSRSWFASLLTPTRVVPALPSASSLVRPISVPFGRTESGSDSVESGVEHGYARGHGSRRSNPLRRSPTEERLAALVSASSPPQNEGIPVTSPSFVKPSPFASHPFIPPSGAPGFTGDRDWNTGDFEYEDEFAGTRGGRRRPVAKGKGVKLVGRKESTVGVLDQGLADELRPHLPPLARLPHTWTLLYSLDQDGISLNTLYTQCARAFAIPTTSSSSKSSSAAINFGGVLVEGGGGSTSVAIRAPPPGSEGLGMVLVVRDGEGDVFGAWIAEGVRLSHGSYYGGGDAFLFSAPEGCSDQVNVYKWTGRNNFVALCDPESISFGGGDGHYGLYLDASLLEGTTHRCPTFDNEPLAKGENVGGMVAFDCVGVEVWGVGG